LSVTVSTIVLEPPDVYVWVVVAPVPLAVPSPQFHEYASTVPSGSFEVVPLTVTVRFDTVTVKAASGPTLTGTA
jgi:hypothetical protein